MQFRRQKPKKAWRERPIFDAAMIDTLPQLQPMACVGDVWDGLTSQEQAAVDRISSEGGALMAITPGNYRYILLSLVLMQQREQR